MRKPRKSVLFVQGGGEGTHDEWDNVLVDSLGAGLGPQYEVRYPRMPDEGNPSYPRWSAAIGHELAHLDEGAVVAGHSIGATILVQALVDRPPKRQLAAIVLIAAPFVGDGGWPGDDFEFAGDFGDRLPAGAPVYVFHGTEDETAPVTHAALYADVIPRALVHVLPGRDHQLNSDLSEVALAIRRIMLPDPGIKVGVWTTN